MFGGGCAISCCCPQHARSIFFWTVARIPSVTVSLVFAHLLRWGSSASCECLHSAHPLSFPILGIRFFFSFHFPWRRHCLIFSITAAIISLPCLYLSTPVPLLFWKFLTASVRASSSAHPPCPFQGCFALSVKATASHLFIRYLLNRPRHSGYSPAYSFSGGWPILFFKILFRCG